MNTMEAVNKAPFYLQLTSEINCFVIVYISSFLNSEKKTHLCVAKQRSPLQSLANLGTCRHLGACWVHVLSHINTPIFWEPISQLKFPNMNCNIRLLKTAVKTDNWVVSIQNTVVNWIHVSIFGVNIDLFHQGYSKNYWKNFRLWGIRFSNWTFQSTLF